MLLITVLSYLNSPKDLDPSYKTGLDFGDCFGGTKNSVLQSKKYGRQCHFSFQLMVIYSSVSKHCVLLTVVVSKDFDQTMQSGIRHFYSQMTSPFSPCAFQQIQVK